MHGATIIIIINIFLFFKISRPTLEPVRWVPAALPLEIKQRGGGVKVATGAI